MGYIFTEWNKSGRGVILAARIFEIIGAVVVLIVLIIMAFILPIIARLLKGINKTLCERESDITGKIGLSMTTIDEADEQIEVFDAITSGIKASMKSAIGFSERVVSFLRSKGFQVGLSIAIWSFFFFIALPRALVEHGKKKQRKPIPPPSWEKIKE